MGDGFFVAFPDPRAAVDCAAQVQRRLAEHRHQHGFAPQIRIGVHGASSPRSTSGSTDSPSEVSRSRRRTGP